MGKLSDILNSVRAEPDFDRARQLASNDYQLIADLVQTRKDSGMNQVDVAELLGISQQAVSKIESYDGDPQLSTLRKYANAVGAIVQHVVTKDAQASTAQQSGLFEACTFSEKQGPMHIRTSDSRIRQSNRRTAGPQRSRITAVKRVA